ncbi:hypothetical protein [Chamaesiphon sp.]|uniref:hypothetical protein n=1 Tax=Chamaesiphon sp. TaxID=2814140 RepID=UPI00359317FA
MKSNLTLQQSIRFTNPAQKLWYAAHVLLAASTNSPAIKVRDAVPAVVAKPAVVAQTAKPARAASAPVLASANTVGYAFGALYLNSPAYPIGTAIPAISAKPASAAVAAVPAIVAVPAVAAITVPAVVAVKGYEDAITITQSATELTVVVELPTAQNVGLAGSNKLVIGEITPSNLQATAWLDTLATPIGTSGYSYFGVDLATDTLEQFLYKNALLCTHTIADVVRNVNGSMISCKRIAVTMAPMAGFDPLSDSLQLDKMTNVTVTVMTPEQVLAQAIALDVVEQEAWITNGRNNEQIPYAISEADVALFFSGTNDPAWRSIPLIGSTWFSVAAVEIVLNYLNQANLDYGYTQSDLTVGSYDFPRLTIGLFQVN